MYEKQIVKWAETKLFLLTQQDILDVKEQAISENLPIEDFTESLDEISERNFFSHRELARWQNYFIRNKRDDLAKRINPLVGTEAEQTKKGRLAN